MSQLATFDEYISYFQAIATSHVDISGFKFGDKDVVQSSARSDMPTRVLWLDAYDPVAILDNASDNHTGRINGSLIILAPDPEEWAAQRTLYSSLENIGKQIISKILKDYNAGTFQAQINGYRYGWSEHKLGATPYMGCKLDIAFLRPERLVYDATKWE